MSQETIKRVLGKKLYEDSTIHIDGWSWLHFLLFLLLGIYFPHKWAWIIMGTILFEAFERMASKRTKLFKESTKDTISDFGINILGYFIGSEIITT